MKSKNILKMALGMVVCCLAPVLLVSVLSVLGIASGNRIISFIAPLLCPLIMIGMMLPMMIGMKGEGHKGHSCCGGGMDKDSKESDSNSNADTMNLEKLK